MSRLSMFVTRRRASSTVEAERALSLQEPEKHTQDMEYTALDMSQRWTADLSGRNSSNRNKRWTMASSFTSNSTDAERQSHSHRMSVSIAPNQLSPTSPTHSQSPLPKHRRKSSIFVHTTETIVVTSIFDQGRQDCHPGRVSSCSSERRRSSRLSSVGTLFRFRHADRD